MSDEKQKSDTPRPAQNVAGEYVAPFVDPVAPVPPPDVSDVVEPITEGADVLPVDSLPASQPVYFPPVELEPEPVPDPEPQPEQQPAPDEQGGDESK